MGGPILRFIIAYPLQNKNNITYIKDQIRNAQIYMKNYESHEGDDIRKYLEVRNKTKKRVCKLCFQNRID